MLELLIFVTFLGLVLACQRRLGLANPFQIYFFLWLLVFLGYYSYQGSFAVISSEVLMMLLGAKCLALLLLIAALTATTKNHRANFVPIDVRDNRIIAAAQIVVCIAMPFVYMKALSLSDGNDVFSVLGYVRLRTSITEDGIGFGVFAYFFILSYAITSIVVILYATKRISVYWLIFSVAISIFYAYLGTARTAFLLFLLLVLIPLILMRFLKLKGIAFSALLTVAIFIFVAGMTAKGISVDSNLAENVETFSSNIRSYTVAPLLALSQFAGSNFPVDLGKNSFRTVIASAYVLGLSESPPVSLIRDFVYVPDATNVYTVYEAYLRDFWYFGMFMPPLFLAAHWWLYNNARRVGGSYIFFYAASTYPLVMQFFQDQYFSLLSTWVQVGLWYWILLKSKKRVDFPGGKTSHD